MSKRTSKRIGFFTRVLDDTSPAERYKLALEQAIFAEQVGFDSVWVAQHHFDGTEGGLPAPFVFLSHVAARTSRIRLGTGVITLPLENPLRIAEDAAVFDLMSGGRLELGFGTGGTPATFAAFGQVLEERGPVYGNHLATLREVWAGQDVTEGRRLYPPARHLNDRVWQATFSAEGGRRAGEAGDGLLLSRTQPRPQDQPHLALSEIQIPIVEAYLGALPKGRAPRILASRSVFVADDRDTARHYADIGLRRIRDRFVKMGHTLPGDTLDDLIKAFDTHLGTPEEVASSLREDATLQYVTDIAVQVHSVDPPHEFILRSIELFAQKVVPALGWSTAAEATAKAHPVLEETLV
jgi:putative FMN-dependent luciferase-like monooxygenase